MLKYSNNQIRKYSNIKYSNTQILRYSNTQIPKYSNTELLKYKLGRPYPRLRDFYLYFLITVVMCRQISMHEISYSLFTERTMYEIPFDEHVT